MRVSTDTKLIDTSGAEFGINQQNGIISVSAAELNALIASSNSLSIDLNNLLSFFKIMFYQIYNPPYIDKTVNQIRAQVTGTLTTVTTVTGLTNIDSIQGRLLMMNSNANAWAIVVRARIT